MLIDAAREIADPRFVPDLAGSAASDCCAILLEDALKFSSRCVPKAILLIAEVCTCAELGTDGRFDVCSCTTRSTA